jgi:hypothetical protein
MLIRALGARDLVVGLGLVTADDLTPWLRARLACELADLVLHTAGALSGQFSRNRALAIAAAAGTIAAFEYVVFLAD